MARNPEVDEWFRNYENPQKALVLRLREIILSCDVRVDECLKWKAPTFTYKGNIASFYPKSKQHASLMFHTGALIPGDHSILEGGGDTSRVLKISSLTEAEAKKEQLEAVIRDWCDWRDSETS